MATKRIPHRNRCQVADCDAVVKGHGLCQKHYFRWRKYGNPLIGKIQGAQTKHGNCTRVKKSPEYQSWASMLGRCFNPNRSHFHRYGGRGITVCERWRNSFQTFLEDMGPRPTPKHTLDRFPNNSGNYEPGNVRWATRKEQSRNRGNNTLITADGLSLCVTEWAERLGASTTAIYHRINNLKWDESRAVLTPVRRR